MDRKEFISNSINKVFKPIWYLILLIIGLVFLKNIFSDVDNAGKSSLLWGLIIFSTIILLGILKYILSSIWNSISEKMQSHLNTLNRILEYLMIPFLIYYCYINWNANELLIVVFGSALLITYLKIIIKPNQI